VPAGVAGLAATIAAAGHGAASGVLDLGIDALHALAAGLWIGGLAALVGLGRSVEPRALHKFSTLAMTSVLTLIVTGILNSLRQLDSVEQLWQTRYGLTLLIKLVLVAGTLGRRSSLPTASAAERGAVTLSPHRGRPACGRAQRHRAAQYDRAPTQAVCACQSDGFRRRSRGYGRNVTRQTRSRGTWSGARHDQRQSCAPAAQR
jgi:hypothetical protein